MTAHNSDRQVACDRQSARTVDEQGFLHVEDCNISKACVNPYWGAEIPNHEQLKLDLGKTYMLFRDPKELEKAADTFNNLPLMDNHVEVSAFDLEDDTVKKRIVGSTGTNAKFVAPYLQNTLVVWTAGAIEGVMSKEQTELSCAYRYELDQTPGEYEGVKYDMRMTNIRGNHVALVDEGRAGPDVTVKDHKFRPRIDMVRLGKLVADALKPAIAEIYKMPKQAAIKEHVHLVGMLKQQGEQDLAEAAEQESELKNKIEDCSVTMDEDDIISDIIEHEEGHKSSKGKSAPWVIKSEKTGKVLWSGPSKEEAVKQLANIEGHKAEDCVGSVTSDDNPEGHNQYSGGAGAKKDLKSQARMKTNAAMSASNVANAKGHLASPKDHLRAAEAHREAVTANRSAGNHKQADLHSSFAAHHQSSAYLDPDIKAGRDSSDRSITMDIEERDDVSAKSGVSKYGEIKFADPKNKKYPLDTPEHVRAALSYWGQAKNQQEYSEEDRATIQRRIEAAARTRKFGRHAEGNQP